ncbi:MAG: hypothetical protein ABI667_05940 [Sphingomicrobium sp.]
MPRGILLLILLLLVVVGAIFFLSSSADKVPQSVIESEVATDASAK